MYERSAIVLENYIYKSFGYNEVNNIKNNFDNYCELIEKLDLFQNTYTKEQTAIQEFENVSNEIKNIQTSAEKLYKKGAKLEYNRNILFGNIAQNIEEIEKCIINIEEDIEKNYQNLKELRESFINAIRDYKDKKEYLSNCKKDRKSAEDEYNISLNSLKEEFYGINTDNIKYIKDFVTSENEEEKESLISVLNKNGKGEKNPFDENVISNAAVLGIDIAKKEAICYMQIYDKTNKLLKDIESESIRIDKYQEYAKNAKAKLGFLFAEKEYLVQFLDNERLTVIHGKKTHEKLMKEACDNLLVDVKQINNLYELILRETTGKPTKRAYKELYNKSYLIDIEEKEAIFKKEKFKVNTSAGALINLNYWRIEGIKNIYTVFYNTISEVFGKDLVEFDVPKQINESDVEDTSVNTGVNETETGNKNEIYNNIEENQNEELSISKNNNNNNDDDDDDNNDSIDFEMLDDDIELSYIQSNISFDDDDDDDNNGEGDITNDEETDIVDDNDNYELKTGTTDNFELINDNDFFQDEEIQYEQDDQFYEEESLFSKAKKIKTENEKLNELEEFDGKVSKKNIFNKLKKINVLNKRKTIKD